MNSNFSQAITQIIVKGKSALYLVLKKKPLPIEILEALSAEVEIRYEKFLLVSKFFISLYLIN